MTIDLDILHNMRDYQLALEVSEKAEMGWFDVEFTVYGCAFLKNGNRYYRLSSEAEKIYDFIENSLHTVDVTSTIHKISRRYPVPVGMREFVAVDVKKELAREMASIYSVGFFKTLNDLANEATEDSARSYLEKQWETVEYSFDEAKINQFRQMVEYAYLHRKITHTSRMRFLADIHEEEKSMENIGHVKSRFKKIFYGTAYQIGDSIKFFINARKGNVYKKQMDLELRGVYASQIFSHTYYFNHNVQTTEVRKMFEQALRENITEEKMAEWQSIYTRNTKLSQDTFNQRLIQISAQYGEAVVDTLRHYGYRWGVLW